MSLCLSSEFDSARLPMALSSDLPLLIFPRSGYVFYSSLYYIPQFFQVALSYSPIHAATILLPFLVTQTVASFISGVLVSKTGRYRVLVVPFAFFYTCSPMVPTYYRVLYTLDSLSGPSEVDACLPSTEAHPLLVM